MNILFLFLIIFLLSFPLVRFLISKLPILIKQFVISTIDYFKFKRYNECPEFGMIDCYCGLFGMGKTKQAVKRVTETYKRYNGVEIWKADTQEWITQEINVFSNVKLSAIPYTEFTTMQQMVDCMGTNYGVVNIFLIDEASVVFNSREYKENFNTLALNTILTSRHHRIGIILTSQRFNHLDALLRQVTSTVIQCRYFKYLHIQSMKYYNAWDLECSKNPELCKPLAVRYEYTTGLVYSYYDTFAMVSDVKKACEDKRYVPDTITLNQLGDSTYDKSVVNSRRFLNRGRK